MAMTKIGVFSDLHLECHSDESLLGLLADDLDIVILAGDIIPYSSPRARGVMEAISRRWKQVVMVRGNHCYWGSSSYQIADTTKNLLQGIDNIYNLELGVVEIEGIRIAGATTWFPDTPTARAHKRMLNDYQMIEDFEPWAYDRHYDSIAFWGRVEADIWVTHHLPSYQGVGERWRGNSLNCYFVAPEMEDIILEMQPQYCFYGHSHSSGRFSIGETICMSNPYGYLTKDRRSLNEEFDYGGRMVWIEGR